MPTRKGTERVISTEMQGDDSWVEYRVPLVEESERLAFVQGLTTVEAMRIGYDIIATHVIEWNWVDAEGVPLAQPSGDPDVVRKLTNWEYKWLIDLILGSTERRKN
jgi:hypothetical protein